MDLEIIKLENVESILLFHLFRNLLNGYSNNILLISTNEKLLNLTKKNWEKLLLNISRDTMYKEYHAYKIIQKYFSIENLWDYFQKFKKNFSIDIVLINSIETKIYNNYQDIVFLDKCEYFAHNDLMNLETNIIKFLDGTTLSFNNKKSNLFNQINFYINSNINNNILYLIQRLDVYLENNNLKTKIDFTKNRTIILGNRSSIKIKNSNSSEMFVVSFKKNKMYIDDVPLKDLLDKVLEIKYLKKQEFDKYLNLYQKMYSLPENKNRTDE